MSTFRASTLSPGGSDTGSVRQSPFRRQNSHAGGQRETTPTSSPARSSTAGTPLKMGSLSPEKASPFVRRPSQITSQASERPSSPLARPPSTFGPPLRNVNMSKQARVESGSDAGIGGLDSPMASPTRRLSAVETPASPEPGSPSPLDGMRPPPVRDQPTINLPVPSRPQAQRIPTSSSIATLRQPNFNNARNNSASSYGSNSPKQNPSLRPSRPAGPVRGASAYTSLPPPLLHALRSSFEILDPSATGSITPTTLPDTLQQIGLPAPTPAQLVSHFPPPHSAGLNLATYLDTLSSPLAQLSPPDELLAAFAAFDIDDSGQIDARELREALLKTGPEPGEEDYRMSESEIDGVLGEFVGRRAFGAKGLNAAKGKGEVFRYRDFMANLTGGGGGQEQEVMG